MRTERPGQLAGLGAAVLIAITALFSLWFFGRKLPEPLVVAVAAVLGILIFPLTHA